MECKYVREKYVNHNHWCQIHCKKNAVNDLENATENVIRNYYPCLYIELHL